MTALILIAIDLVAMAATCSAAPTAFHRADLVAAWPSVVSGVLAVTITFSRTRP